LKQGTKKSLQKERKRQEREHGWKTDREKKSKNGHKRPTVGHTKMGDPHGKAKKAWKKSKAGPRLAKQRAERNKKSQPGHNARAQSFQERGRGKQKVEKEMSKRHVKEKEKIH